MSQPGLPESNFRLTGGPCAGITTAMMTPFRCGAHPRLITLGLSFLAAFAGHANERSNRVTAVRLPAAGQVVKAQLGANGAIHHFTRLDKDGAVLPPGEVRTTGTAGMRTGLLALSASDGAILVAWKNKDVLGWQLYNVKGQPQGEPGSATSSGNGAAGVVLRDGRFLVFPKGYFSDQLTRTR